MAPPIGLGGFPLRSSWFSAGKDTRNLNRLVRKSPGQDDAIRISFGDFFFTPWADQYANYGINTYDGSSAYTYHSGPRALQAYTLTATQQTYSVSGVNSILKADRKLLATQQTYAVSTVSSLLTLNRRITATVQTYSVSGVNSILKAGRKLIGTQQTYSVSGVNSILRASRRIAATQQTYSVSTQTAILKAGRNLIATNGSYAVTPYDSVLTYTPASNSARVFIIT